MAWCKAYRMVQDLDNFRKEVYLMSRVKHPNVVQLLAGRVLPPGEYDCLPEPHERLFIKSS